ncbi:MAG: YlxR family protein [Chloroflexi bacterium]|nr:YlxR family protein [Chloroflexota bacterium]
MSDINACPRRRVPERTCVACRRKDSKGSLLRLVRTATGEILIDKAGKQNGRGAYLCPFRNCWESAVKGTRLEYVLKGKIELESKKRLLEYGQTLPVRYG